VYQSPIQQKVIAIPGNSRFRLPRNPLGKAKCEHKKLKLALLEIAGAKMMAAGSVFVSQPMPTIPMPILPA
jgi:hypothetical protein